MSPKMEQMVRVDERVGTQVAASYLYWSLGLNLLFAFATCLLLLLFLPVLALCIYLDSPGPVFYAQERLGCRGIPFRMYKFRSMHVPTHSRQHHPRTTRQDARVTRVGHFLRLTHLDELPQLLNILRGEMNLIGPRPELAEIAVRLERQLPGYPRRFEVKPGLTGWAQVMYHYGDTLEDEKAKLAYELYYIEHQTARLDVSILFRTVGEVLFGHGR